MRIRLLAEQGPECLALIEPWMPGEDALHGVWMQGPGMQSGDVEHDATLEEKRLRAMAEWHGTVDVQGDRLGDAILPLQLPATVSKKVVRRTRAADRKAFR